MTVVTLPEAAKAAANSGQELRAALIEVFAMRAPLLRVMPFENISGMGMIYNKEGVLPGIAFRGVNEAYTPTVGVINPESEQLKIFGGELTVDSFIQQTMPGTATRQLGLQAKALADFAQQNFIKGNSASSPKQFDGLERRLTGSQVISAGSTDGGAALSMLKLDQAIDTCEQPTHLLMTKQTRRNINSYLRGSGTAIFMAKDEFGRPVEVYNGLPIIVADEFGSTAALGQTEASNNGGGTATATSIYVLRLEPGYLSGIQNGDMNVIDLGVLQTTPARGWRAEWYMSMAVFHPRAAVRLRDIGNTTVTA